MERCEGWLKSGRSVATRYEKLAVNCLATATLAAIGQCLRVSRP